MLASLNAAGITTLQYDGTNYTWKQNGPGANNFRSPDPGAKNLQNVIDTNADATLTATEGLTGSIVLDF